MTFSPWTPHARYLVLVSLFFASSLFGCSRKNENIRLVLITLDTLRYDSFAGSEEREPTMPLLSRWATGATTFDRFFSATASTQPSHASMFTGLHPWQHGVSRNGQNLAEKHETVAEILRSEGFSTAAVVSSFPVGKRFGFAQGFDKFEDDFDAGRVRDVWLRASQKFAKKDLPAAQAGDPAYCLADVITQRALAQLDLATAHRQFFWFHYFDPHMPYGDTIGETMVEGYEALKLAQSGQDPTPAVENARRLYDQDVAFLDKSLNRLLGRLEHDAADFETHVVIVADHGESFGEQGSMAHGRRLIPSQIHVPFTIRSPWLGVGVRNDVAGSIDIATTLLTLSGLDLEHRLDRPAPGRDLIRSPSSRRVGVFGMRRTFEQPYHDLRLDGRIHTIGVDDYLFYYAEEAGGIYRGNGAKIIPPDTDPLYLSEQQTQALQTLFGSFETMLTRNAAESVVDPIVEKALRSLGYTE